MAAGTVAAAALLAVHEFDALGEYGPSGRPEVAAVVLYATSVWLAVRNSVWTWPTGIVATAIYLYIFWDLRLYADAGLQVVFIGFSLAGLWAWWRRDADGRSGQAERASAGHLLAVLLAIAAGTVLVRAWLIEVGGAAPLWDALLTSGSLGALYLLVRKRIENWYLWMVLDAGYVALFVDRRLYLSAVLYAVLFAMVVKAARDWRELLDRPAGAPA